MGSRRIPGSARTASRDAGAPPSSAALFRILWDTVADVLGTVATANIVRRAALRAAPRNASLGELAVSFVDVDYFYTLPHAFNEPADGPPVALRELVSEMRPLLEELTGQIILRRIDQIPEFREQGIVSA